MKKIVSLLLALTTLLSCSVFCIHASALSNDVHDILFDWEYYYNTNSDVARAFGRNPSSLKNHYNTYGKKEGRAPSVLFAPKTYLGLYGDLRSAFGNDYKRAYDHFVTYGIKEGRKASDKFDVTVYKANYADLRAAFGNDNLKYLKHYREYGIKEGRNAVTRIAPTPTPKPTPTPAPQPTIVTNLENGASYLIHYKSTTMGVNVQFAPRSGIGNLVLDSTSNREGNEIWKFTYNAQYQAYYITPQYRPGAAMNALYGASAQKGSQARLHDSNVNDTASLWRIEKSGSYYRFKNVACGYYLDVAAGKTTAGTKINIWTDDTSTQHFTLTKVSGNTPTPTPTPTPGKNIYINGIDIGYAAGEYFTTTGTQCACHNRDSCGEASDCTCKIVSGACQCKGFAMWCQNKLFGTNENANTKKFNKIGYVAAGQLTASKIKELVSSAPLGSHIRTNYVSKDLVNHSMIIIAKDANGFTVAQANGSNNNEYSKHFKCRIGTSTYTWNGYASSTYGIRGIQYIAVPVQ